MDIGAIDELTGITDVGDALLIGARTTHYQVVHDPLVREHCGLLAQATATVADPAVRHRGTLGGSLAHGDPAGDLPAVVLALDGMLVVRGPGGQREIPAGDFFVDYLTTALEPGEILTGVRVPKLGEGWGYRYEKFHRTAQAWATVGVAALARRANGQVAEARIGLTNMGAVRSGLLPPSRPSPEPTPAPRPSRPLRLSRTRERSHRPTCTGRPITGVTSRGS